MPTRHCSKCFRALTVGQDRCQFCGTLFEAASAEVQNQTPSAAGFGAVTGFQTPLSTSEVDRLPSGSRQLIERLVKRYGSDWLQPWNDVGRWPRWLEADYLGGEPRWAADFFSTIEAELGRQWILAGGLQDHPAWLWELKTCFLAQVARVFILHGNVNDYHFHPDLGYVELKELLLGELGPDVTFYSLSQGLELPVLTAGSATEDGASTGTERRQRNDQEPLWQQIRGDFEILDQRLRGATPAGAVAVLQFIDKLFPVGAQEIEREILIEMVLRWAVDPALPQGNAIILTTTNYEGLNHDLRSRVNKVQGIEIQRPRRDDRLLYILAKLHSFQTNTAAHGRTQRQVGALTFSQDFGPHLADQARSFADRTAGLNLMGIEDVILRATTHNAGRLEVSDVNEHKRSLLAGESVGLLEMVEPRHDFADIGGLRGVKERLLEICRGIRSQNATIRRILPMGILFLGPPGTGKTLMAEALAKASGLTFVKLGNFRDMYVGQSEKNLSIVLQLLKSLAPVVVFVDEIDQMIGQRGASSDSGPEKRLFGKMLEFMSDTSLRGRVLWVGASNEPDKLDTALKRPGRFDLKLPFFLPDRVSRQSIFEILMDKRGEDMAHALSDQDFQVLAQATEGFSGAEIEMAVNEASRLAVRDDPQSICVQRRHFDEALRRYDPADSIRKYREMEADIAADIPHRDLLPERYQNTMHAGGQGNE